MTSDLQESFYSDLPYIHEFIDITELANFASMPSSWFIIITDIVNSTILIETGHYKNVNLVGACTIVAMLNIADPIDIPFVFGGDGASILIPANLLVSAQNALINIQNLVKDSFAIDLRVGIIPVAKVMREHEIRVAKLQVSPNYSQAIFKGGGLTYATRLVKDSDTYQLKHHSSDGVTNFAGLECRWQDINGRHGEILSLIVQATTANQSQSDQVYKRVITKISKIYGAEHKLNPVSPERLNLSFSPKQLSSETKAKSKKTSWLGRQSYLLKITLENLLAWIVIKLKLKTTDIDWGDYKNIVTDATDYRKFDDLLRMVISSTTAQRKQLLNYLETEYVNGRLVYGFHVSDRALMTCLVFERNGRQVHFIDGADGGYAYAAKVMKAKFKV
ncbi:Protein of unknown function (DUF3095) [Synechococcus sp. PCC 7502]|uniref:DUF3095 domain-containing protein n=1 Tax=Synechococcus sp. PCC 7502 TaxID=1173263 RepID=UPI00029F81D8|nr:DUF3095 domain-containing protein [Synechococcus sp. PCC 7502]AFY72849.1 Protein of unknown function (DUF3095) [Synechococcus sp. PCC 7502]